MLPYTGLRLLTDILKMQAFKLLRLRKDGTLGSLFVGRKYAIPVNCWLTAIKDLPHPGLAHRPGFHCCSTKSAPHIKMTLKNGEKRVWCSVTIKNYTVHERPECQGGIWYVADQMRIDAIL